jgi:hypothetical protein
VAKATGVGGAPAAVSRSALALGDNSSVHLGTAGLDCLLAYGRRWRGAATRALAGTGFNERLTSAMARDPRVARRRSPNPRGPSRVSALSLVPMRETGFCGNETHTGARQT